MVGMLLLAIALHGDRTAGAVSAPEGCASARMMASAVRMARVAV